MAESAAAPGIDVAAIMRSFTAAQASVQATGEDLLNVMGAGRDAEGAAQEAANEEATAKNSAVRAAGERALRKDANNKAAAAAFGTDPNASTSIIEAVAQNILGIREELNVRDTTIRDKMDTRFLDDPISWMTNQFTLPGDIAAYNMRYAHLEQENTILGALQDRTKEQVVVNNAIAATTSEVEIAALEAENLAAAKTKVAASQNRLAQLGVQGIFIRRALNADQFNEVLQMHTAQVSEQQLQLSTRHLRIAERSLQLNEEMKNLQMEERRDNLEARAALQGKLNQATDLVAAPRISVAEFKMLSGKKKDVLENLMLSMDTEEGRLGYNVATSISNANEGNFRLTDGMNIVRKKLTEALAHLPESPLWSSMKPGDKIVAQESTIEAKLKLEARSIPEEGGIFSASPLFSVLKIPGVAILPIAKELAPLATQETYKTSMNDVLRTAGAMIAAGKATPDDLAGQIKAMYSAINVDNSEQRKYARFAIPLPTTFKQTAFVGMGWNSTQVVDGTNRAQLQQVLTRMEAARINTAQQTAQP